ncbi:TLC domain-containing protein [Dissophora ornata]|nr:TLC domain-containing protein [Dissophora ornata]
MSAGILDSLGLAMLSNHWTTLLGSAIACNFIVQLSQLISPQLFPGTYPKLQGAKKLNWDVHVVSSVHAISIVILSAPLLWNETLMKDKVFGYDYYAGQVYAVACGYFLWDTIHSIRHFKAFGIGFVFHGFCSFSVFILGFRPFLQYYGSVFLMFELSTPFLNIHWFMDKLGMTGTIYQLINGVILLAVFLCARIIFGVYMSYYTYIQVMTVVDRVPMHLIVIYSAANVVLNTLNLYWFYKMIESLVKRFKPSKGGKSSQQERVAEGTRKGKFAD